MIVTIKYDPESKKAVKIVPQSVAQKLSALLVNMGILWCALHGASFLEAKGMEYHEQRSNSEELVSPADFESEAQTEALDIYVLGYFLCCGIALSSVWSLLKLSLLGFIGQLNTEQKLTRAELEKELKFIITENTNSSS